MPQLRPLPINGMVGAQRGCDIVGFPVDKNGPACISFLSKKQ